MSEPKRSGHVLHVAAEMSPHISTGGLAEVMGSLPRALSAMGWESTVLLPRYANLGHLTSSMRSLWSGTIEADGDHTVEVLELEDSADPRLLLLQCDELFGRDGVYGDAQGIFADNDVRYAVLSKAALVVAEEIGADILHAHDWHASPAVVEAAGRPGLGTVLTLHNYAYRGDFGADRIAALGWPAGADAVGSFLERGVLAADVVTTVSTQYAQEIFAAAQASGDALARRAKPPVGIVNGLDPSVWDPATDPRLAANFDVDTLDGRVANRDALRRELDLDPGKNAVLGFLGRFAPQKGLDVLLDVAPRLLAKGTQLVLHGDGDPDLESRARQLAADHPGKVATVVGFDRDFVFRLLAGIDLLVMPSRFEPCGLTQLQAMRYGAIAVAHATGGLKDTIHPLGARGHRATASNGFLFQTLTPRALSLAVGKALRYLGQPQSWRTLQRNAMSADVSWSKSAEAYADVYRDALEVAAARAVAPVSPAPPEVPATVEPQAGYSLEGPPLAERYDRATLHLAVQSPRLLYAYWELPEANELRLMLLENEARRVLARVSRQGEYWIDVEPGRDYRVALENEAGAEQLQSNLACAPPDGPLTSDRPPTPSGRPESVAPRPSESLPAPSTSPETPPAAPTPARFLRPGYPDRGSGS